MAETRPLVVALDVLPPASQEVIRGYFGGAFETAFASQTDEESMRALVADATVFLSSFGWIPRWLMEAAPNLRVIQKLGVGVEKFDLDAAAERGVVVFKGAGINADAVAELTLLLTLSVNRNLVKAMRAAREGRFDKEKLRAESVQLLGKTVGLFGLGNVGRAVAKRFQSFGAEIIYYDAFRASEESEAQAGVRFVSFDQLLAESDILSLHAPSTPETNGIFDAAALSRMKPDAVLINTARGELIDEPALIDALLSGHLRGAGLDVVANEPISLDSPLLTMDQVVITPHIGGAVGDNFPRVINRAYENVTAALNGESLRREDVVVGPPSH